MRTRRWVSVLVPLAFLLSAGPGRLGARAPQAPGATDGAFRLKAFQQHQALAEASDRKSVV